MRIALHTCLPDNFLVCWPTVSALSVFHGNLPQEIWGTYFPHRESTSWNFPAKIWNSLRLIPSFDMVSKFPGSLGGDTWPSFWRKELIRIIRIKKYRVQGSRFRSNISETVRDIRVPFSLLARCKSHARIAWPWKSRSNTFLHDLSYLRLSTWYKVDLGVDSNIFEVGDFEYVRKNHVTLTVDLGTQGHTHSLYDLSYLRLNTSYRLDLGIDSNICKVEDLRKP